MNKQKVWLITGASGGMGLILAKAVLAKGDKVIVTTRNVQAPALQINDSDDRLLPLQLDITSDNEVKNAIAKAIQHFGQIDIVVNNAGYYLVGSLEEITDNEFRKTMDVNLFGTVNIIRHIMPHFRERGSGHVINISSNMGYVGFANTGSYNAAKFAVIGLSEALAAEAKPFGIKVTVVAPGMFRTNFMNEGALAVAKQTVTAYGVMEHKKMLDSYNGHQPGDPKKLAAVLINITELDQPPVHLLLGPDSYHSVLEQRVKEAVELEQWKQLSLSTDFD